MEKVREKKVRRFPLYVTKKMGVSKWKYWLIRAGGILIAFLLAGIVCAILKPGTFGTFYSELIRGCFDFSDISTIIDLLVLFSLFLLIALALTPAFKMKFWNIGAEGQILIACLVSAGIAKFSPSTLPNIVILFLCCIFSILAGIVWSVIPAIFKAFFNTNETLFTLMMNYIATILSGLAVSIWIKNGSMSFGLLTQGVFPEIFDNSGTLVIVFALLTFVFMYFYIKKSIHGYEMSVVGESASTARYVGINIRRVTIRTMIFAGSIMGFIGFLIVCAINQTFNDSIVGGKGFTGVLIAWLGHFDPLEIALFSFLSAVMQQGTTTAASAVNMSSFQFSNICTGIFFFVIISCEFFSNYQIKMHREKDFEEYFAEQKEMKLNEINAEQNKFKHFIKKSVYYITYPIMWLSHKNRFSKAKEQNMRKVGE